MSMRSTSLPGISSSVALKRRRKPKGRPITPETPGEIIESAAFEVIAECVFYRDADRITRLHGDDGCDEAVRRMERAHANDDDVAFKAAADDYWTSDREEDGAAEHGDLRVAVAHAHAQVIPAQCIEWSMGALPATAQERGLSTSSARGKAGR